MNEIDDSLGAIRDYIDNLRQRINILTYEKNKLIREVSIKTNTIRETKEELTRWEKSLERFIKNA